MSTLTPTQQLAIDVRTVDLLLSTEAAQWQLHATRCQRLCPDYWHHTRELDSLLEQRLRFTDQLNVEAR